MVFGVVFIFSVFFFLPWSPLRNIEWVSLIARLSSKTKVSPIAETLEIMEIIEKIKIKRRLDISLFALDRYKVPH